MCSSDVIGLPPDLPGMISAYLVYRQIWWWGTVLATGGGILLFAKLGNITGAVIGLVLIVIPHIIGAPAPLDVPAEVPAHLATAFAANSLFSLLAFWLMLGVFYGWLNQRVLENGRLL